MNKKGRIIAHGVSLEKHENDIAVLFTGLGYDVELIPFSYTKGQKTADAIIDGVEWEFKSPQGDGRWTLERTLKRAMKQSPNIVIDLRRLKCPDERCVVILKKLADEHRGVRRLKVVMASGDIIDVKR